MKFLKTYLNDVKVELRKVTWLSKDEMLGSTMVVWVFAFIVCIFLFIVDFSVAGFISRLLGIS
jgi:preprotein translocase subunit SecE